MPGKARTAGDKPRKKDGEKKGLGAADLLRLLARGLSITEISRRRGVPRTALVRELRQLAGVVETSSRELASGVDPAGPGGGGAPATSSASPAARRPGMVVGGALSLVAYTDGASRGNPGPAGIGVVLLRDGQILAERGQPIGRATNNVAEYRAVIAALEMAQTYGARELEVRLDSELVVRQLTGVYRVRDARLGELAQEATRLARGLDEVRWVHVPRSQNTRADALANQALDAAASAPGAVGAGGRQARP